MASPYLDCFVAFAPRNDGATYGSFVILRWPRLRPSKDAAEAEGPSSFEAPPIKSGVAPQDDGNGVVASAS